LERDANADNIPDNWTTSGNLSVNDKKDQSEVYIGQYSVEPANGLSYFVVPQRVQVPSRPSRNDKFHPVCDLPNKLPSSKIELPSKRTEYSTRYLNPDGSFTEEIYNEPQFYQDSNDKKWKKIDNTLKSSAKAVGKYENTANDDIARFAEQAGSGDLVSVEKDGKSISLVPDKANSVQGIQSGSSITYPGLFANTDVRYQLQGDAVKEDLIPHKYADRNTSVNIEF